MCLYIYKYKYKLLYIIIQPTELIAYTINRKSTPHNIL